VQFMSVYTKKRGSDGKNVFVSFIVVAVLSMRLDNAKGSDQWGPITPWTIVANITTPSIPLHRFVLTGKTPFSNHIL
jgi:hypothetical protein